MKQVILVVDDQWSDRREGYERLAGAMSASGVGLEIEMDFLESPNQLHGRITRNQYTAAIVDAVLDEYWPTFSISTALKVIGNDLPIAIISERWDRTNSDQINEAWDRPNCRTFLHWRDLRADGSGQVDYAVRAVLSMIADRRRLDLRLTLEESDPVRILHISDIQIGGVESKTLKSEANRCADRILEHWHELPPTFVAFTGDVVEHGSPDQYDRAREWIGYFLARLKLPSLPDPTVLYVPGNHDINLRLAAASRVGVRGGKNTLKLVLSDKIEESLAGCALLPYRRFLSSLSSRPFISQDELNDQSLAWVEARFRHLGIVFYGINTAQPINPFGLPGREVDPDALAEIGNHLQEVIEDCGGTKPIVIGLSHHCPVPADDDGAVTNTGDFERFFRGRSKTALFLHGHTHEHDLAYLSNDGLRLVRSCAATLSKDESARPSDSLRGFNLLELTRELHQVTGLNATSYAWVGKQLKAIKTGSWKRRDDGMFIEKNAS